MTLLKVFPLMLACIFLNPLSMWLGRQNELHFFLGLSSDFWAGVTLGVSIVCGLAFIAIVVVYALTAKASALAEQRDVE
jgi:hypothetical protein